jgi:hypothetical protein
MKNSAFNVVTSRGTALIVVMVGALSSVGLMLRAGQSTPPPLLVLFVVWVVSPFAALVWANAVSKRWPVPVRLTTRSVTFIVTVLALAFYGRIILPPAESPPAFVFVVVPLGSWFLGVIAIPMAAFLTRGRP